MAIHPIFLLLCSLSYPNHGIVVCPFVFIFIFRLRNYWDSKEKSLTIYQFASLSALFMMANTIARDIGLSFSFPYCWPLGKLSRMKESLCLYIRNRNTGHKKLHASSTLSSTTFCTKGNYYSSLFNFFSLPVLKTLDNLSTCYFSCQISWGG